MDRKKLLDAVSLADSIVEKSPVQEELKNLRVKGKEITSSDGVISLRIRLEDDTGLDCGLPADKFGTLLANLSADEIDVRQEEARVSISATGGGRKVSCSYAAAQELAVLDALDFGVDGWTDIGEADVQAMHACSFVASKDAGRGPLCGVHVSAKGAIGADGLRIAHSEMPTRIVAEDGEAFSIPRAAVAFLRKHAGAVNGFARRGGTVYFRIGDAILSAALLTGEYPPAHKFVEQAGELNDTLEFPAAADAALRLALAQQDDTPDMDREVKIAADGKSLRIVSTDGVRYELAEEVEMEEAAPKPFAFRVHPQFLLDILADTRTMRFDPETNFIAFRSGGFLYLATVESD